MKRAFAAICLAGILDGCQNPSERLAGGADDHGNAVAARILVVDSAGNPVANTDVVVRPVLWIPGMPLDSTSDFPDAAHVRTDAGGNCRIGSLREGSYSLLAGGIDQAGMATLHLEGSDSVVMGIYATGAISGRIEGAAAGTRIAMRGRDAVAFSDSTGRFALTGVPAGPASIVIGTGRGTTEMDRIPVHARLISQIDSIPFDSTRRNQVQPLVQLLSHPLPPSILPSSGTYTSMISVSIVAPVLGDSVEVSVNGSPWTSSDGTLLIGASACVRARSTRHGILLSSVSETCYSFKD